MNAIATNAIVLQDVVSLIKKFRNNNLTILQQLQKCLKLKYFQKNSAFVNKPICNISNPIIAI